MFNAVHVLETALLMLAAFLIGATIGVVARLAMRSRKPSSSATAPALPVEQAMPAAPTVEAAPDEASVPVFAQLPDTVPETVVAQRPAGPVMAPARAAGETTSGILVRWPNRPFAALPTEAAHSVPASVATEEIVSGLLASALLGPDEPPPAPVVEPIAIVPEPVEAPADDETAAMRAIEGGWTPRRRPTQVALREPQPPTIEAGSPDHEAANPVLEPAVPVTREPYSSPEPVERPGRPWGIEAPRQGKPDNLTNIIGVLPIIETALNKLGIFHFDQVGTLTDENVEWIEAHLGIEGRIGREHWREQARELSQFVAGQQNAAQ